MYDFLESVAECQTETIVSESSIQEVEARPPVNGDGHGDTEVVFSTYHTGDTEVQTAGFSIVLNTQCSTGAGIEVEITFAGKDKVVSTSHIDTII